MEVCRQSIIMICNEIRLSFCFISCHSRSAGNVRLCAFNSSICSVSERCWETEGEGTQSCQIYPWPCSVELHKGEIKHKKEKSAFSQGHSTSCSKHTYLEALLVEFRETLEVPGNITNKQKAFISSLNILTLESKRERGHDSKNDQDTYIPFTERPWGSSSKESDSSHCFIPAWAKVCVYSIFFMISLLSVCIGTSEY